MRALFTRVAQSRGLHFQISTWFTRWAWLWLSLPWLAAHAAPTTHQGRGAGTAAIDVIALERGCFGCPDNSVLVLRRDGRATRTVVGQARLATADRVTRGQIDAGEFDRLARLVVAERFFALHGNYEDPLLQDGPWATTVVEAGGVEKRVFRRDAAAPAALRTVEAAIEATAARIVFAP